MLSPPFPHQMYPKLPSHQSTDCDSILPHVLLLLLHRTGQYDVHVHAVRCLSEHYVIILAPNTVSVAPMVTSFYSEIVQFKVKARSY